MSILKGLALVDIIQQLHTCACLLSSLAFCHPLPSVIPCLLSPRCMVNAALCCACLCPCTCAPQALHTCMTLLKSAAFFQPECPHPMRAKQRHTSLHSDHIRLPLLQVGV